MQNKLQELTDRLYQEGLSKGKEEGARLVETAQSEAQAIIEKAPFFSCLFHSSDVHPLL